MEKWEQERKIERENNKKLVERLTGIAQALGYTVKLREEEDYFRAHIWAKKNDYILHLSANDYGNKGKIAVGGSFENNKILYGNEYPKNINCSLSKTNEQIIKDIKNRFMPLYEESLALYRSRTRAQDNAAAKRNDIMSKANSVLNLEISKDRSDYPYINYYEDNLKIDVKTFYAGESLRLEIDCDVETALNVLKVLKNKIK